MGDEVISAGGLAMCRPARFVRGRVRLVATLGACVRLPTAPGASLARDNVQYARCFAESVQRA